MKVFVIPASEARRESFFKAIRKILSSASRWGDRTSRNDKQTKENELMDMLHNKII
jgi:hypothetical protein